jgi:hypothetical protein
LIKEKTIVKHKYNNGVMILDFKEDSWLERVAAKNSLKSLFICFFPSNFKAYFCTAIRNLSYFCTPKNHTVDNNKTKSEKLQMEDILIPNAELSAFTIEMDDATTKILKETEQKQDEVLKLKEVDEERLRMVVQL